MLEIQRSLPAKLSLVLALVVPFAGLGCDREDIIPRPEFHPPVIEGIEALLFLRTEDDLTRLFLKRPDESEVLLSGERNVYLHKDTPIVPGDGFVLFTARDVVEDNVHGGGFHLVMVSAEGDDVMAWDLKEAGCPYWARGHTWLPDPGVFYLNVVRNGPTCTDESPGTHLRAYSTTGELVTLIENTGDHEFKGNLANGGGVHYVRRAWEPGPGFEYEIGVAAFPEGELQKTNDVQYAGFIYDTSPHPSTDELFYMAKEPRDETQLYAADPQSGDIRSIARFGRSNLPSIIDLSYDGDYIFTIAAGKVWRVNSESGAKEMAMPLSDEGLNEELAIAPNASYVVRVEADRVTRADVDADDTLILNVENGQPWYNLIDNCVPKVQPIHVSPRAEHFVVSNAGGEMTDCEELTNGASEAEESPNPSWGPNQPSGVFAMLFRFDDLSMVELEHKDEMPPVFSPSGRALAYVSHGEIVLHDLDTGDETIFALGPNAKSPLWWILPE